MERVEVHSPSHLRGRLLRDWIMFMSQELTAAGYAHTATTNGVLSKYQSDLRPSLPR